MTGCQLIMSTADWLSKKKEKFGTEVIKSFEGKCEIMRTLSQPRTLPADIPASHKKVYFSFKTQPFNFASRPVSYLALQQSNHRTVMMHYNPVSFRTLPLFILLISAGCLVFFFVTAAILYSRLTFHYRCFGNDELVVVSLEIIYLPPSKMSSSTFSRSLSNFCSTFSFVHHK